MPFSTWIRDIFGIHKDIVDTEKASLEIKKLEDEERARNLITPATMEDIKKYDPTYRELKRRIRDAVDDMFLKGMKTHWTADDARRQKTIQHDQRVLGWITIAVMLLIWLAILFVVVFRLRR